MFTSENGQLRQPASVTGRFIELYEEVGLPPVRLHDLRHGAATLAYAAGADLKDIQEMLGHSLITITADTHTSLLPEADLGDRRGRSPARTARPRHLRKHRHRSGG
ncbi:tyrosine-type recombinase/integrase [Streptomyces sp. NPDC091292]|uniref:tyrosine-type recombinase/integrase n=1 Tax=Streptomyces sp. NPDC091292 TaxID=3365991 RepID=UPI003815499D